MEAGTLFCEMREGFWQIIPSFEEGTLRRSNKWSATLRNRGTFDLPGRAEVKVAFHLLDRRVRPSSKEGRYKLRVIKGDTCSNSYSAAL